jgi:hypothetical protein
MTTAGVIPAAAWRGNTEVFRARSAGKAAKTARLHRRDAIWRPARRDDFEASSTMTKENPNDRP